MRSLRARRAVMIGTAALLLVAPCAALAQAEPTPPAPALPADLVAAIQRDLKISPDQYLDQADTGQELAKFADTLRGKFPTAYAGAWLDPAGAPMVGLADGPDKAAARTAVEAAGFQVKDQARSERTLVDLFGQLNTWVKQLPAPLAGLVNGAKIDPVTNDIALEVKDTAAGQGLQLPDFLKSVRVALKPATEPALGPSGSSGPTAITKPTKPTEPTKPTAPAPTITLNPVTGATVGKEIILNVKVNPAGAGGELLFEDVTNSADPEAFADAVSVGADGTATTPWVPETAGKRTIKVTFSGPNGVTGSTTQQVTVAKGDSNPVAPTITLNPVTGATVGKEIILNVKVNPAGAGGELLFEDVTNSADPEAFADAVSVGADGTATTPWVPETAGKRTIKVTFSGPNGVTGSTTQQVTVAKGDSNPVASTITLDPIKGATVDKAVTLKAKVNNPSEPDGTVEFKDGNAVLTLASVNDDGTATMDWTPTTAGQHTITATFSGFADVALATTTQKVTVAGGPKPTTTKPKPPAPDAIMGGQAYLAGGLCSLGFNATDGSGHPVAISAGHCAGVGAEAKLGEYPDGTYLGTVDKAVIHGGDYLLINIDDSVAKRFENNFVTTHGGDPLPITGTADPVVGAPACKSGRTTGYTCGKVTAIDQYEFGAGGVWMSDAIKFDACGRPGDSGSAIVTGTKALGITSMVVNANGDCNTSPNTTWGQPINSILKDNPGLKIRTN